MCEKWIDSMTLLCYVLSSSFGSMWPIISPLFRGTALYPSFSILCSTPRAAFSTFTRSFSNSDLCLFADSPQIFFNEAICEVICWLHYVHARRTSVPSYDMMRSSFLTRMSYDSTLTIFNSIFLPTIDVIHLINWLSQKPLLRSSLLQRLLFFVFNFLSEFFDLEGWYFSMLALATEAECVNIVRVLSLTLRVSALCPVLFDLYDWPFFAFDLVFCFVYTGVHVDRAWRRLLIHR